MDPETCALLSRCSRIEPTSAGKLRGYIGHRSEEWVLKRLEWAVERNPSLLVREGKGYTLTPEGYRAIQRSIQVNDAWLARTEEELYYEIGPEPQYND